MENILSTAASRGHVRAVFSDRCRGFAAPLALVEGHLRAVVRSIFVARASDNELAMDSARADLRARIAAEMSGYLVTEPEPDCEPVLYESRSSYVGGFPAQFMTAGRQWPLGCAWRDMAGGPLDSPDILPAGSCKSLRSYGSQQSAVVRDVLEAVESARPFSVHRHGYASGVDKLCVTGVHGWHPDFDEFDAPDCEALDAPDFMPAGSCDELGALFGGCPQVVTRREQRPEPFAERRSFWRQWVGRAGFARSGPAGNLQLLSQTRAGFGVDSLDAPDFMAAGSCRWVSTDFGDHGFSSARLAHRGWLL